MTEGNRAGSWRIVEPEEGPEGIRLNYRMTVAYDGSGFSGFQVQRQRRTVQGELEAALQRITRETIRVKASGRTDSGVHAYGQVVSFATGWRHSANDLCRAVNAVLPEDIAVRDARLVGPEFHARLSACWRLYVYNLYRSEIRSPLLSRYAYRVAGELDLWAIQQGADELIGEHDFAAFGSAVGGGSTVRHVRRAVWVSDWGWPERWLRPACQGMLQFQIEANGFLRGMVRRLVGTLVEIGQGMRPIGSLKELLASGDRSQAGRPAPACGLCLWHVAYE